jgi:hypothetical protein
MAVFTLADVEMRMINDIHHLLLTTNMVSKQVQVQGLQSRCGCGD